MGNEITKYYESPLEAVVRGYKDGFSVLVTRRSEANNLTEVLDGVDTIISEMRRRGYLPSWNVETNGKLSEGKVEEKPIEEVKPEKEKQAESVPVCPTHNKPMVKRQGQWGEFWACPTKENGEFCKYRPPKKK